MPNQRHYAQAISEFLNKNLSLGLFAECFAKSNGDEAKTKAAYIEARAHEFERMEAAAIIAEAVRLEALKKAEAERQASLKRAKSDKIAALKIKYNLQAFISEYPDRKYLKYFNSKQIAEMHAKWLEEKIKEECD
jgi:hypothetical protein